MGCPQHWRTQARTEVWINLCPDQAGRTSLGVPAGWLPAAHLAWAVPMPACSCAQSSRSPRVPGCSQPRPRPAVTALGTQAGVGSGASDSSWNQPERPHGWDGLPAQSGQRQLAELIPQGRPGWKYRVSSESQAGPVLLPACEALPHVGEPGTLSHLSCPLPGPARATQGWHVPCVVVSVH